MEKCGMVIWFTHILHILLCSQVAGCLKHTALLLCCPPFSAIGFWKNHLRYICRILEIIIMKSYNRSFDCMLFYLIKNVCWWLTVLFWAGWKLARSYVCFWKTYIVFVDVMPLSFWSHALLLQWHCCFNYYLLAYNVLKNIL